MDAFAKLLHKIPFKHRIQVLETIDCLRDPACRKTLHIKKLEGSDLLKVRSGKYRISFVISNIDQAVVRFVRLRNEKTYRDV